MKPQWMPVVVVGLWVILLAAGCGRSANGPVLNGKNEETFRTSYAEVVARMNPAEKAEFDAALAKWKTANIQFQNFRGLRGEEAQAEALKALDGMAAATVIAEAAKTTLMDQPIL